MLEEIGGAFSDARECLLLCADERKDDEETV
jgi:hypothetical protein